MSYCRSSLRRCTALALLLTAAAAIPAAAQNFNFGDAASWQAALTNTLVEPKSAPGTVRRVFCDNGNSAVIWMQFFDTSDTVTVGTTTPKFSLPIPEGAGPSLEVDVNFTTSIQLAITTTATGGTAPSDTTPCTITFR